MKRITDAIRRLWASRHTAVDPEGDVIAAALSAYYIAALG